MTCKPKLARTLLFILGQVWRDVPASPGSHCKSKSITDRRFCPSGCTVDILGHARLTISQFSYQTLESILPFSWANFTSWSVCLPLWAGRQCLSWSWVHTSCSKTSPPYSLWGTTSSHPPKGQFNLSQLGAWTLSHILKDKHRPLFHLDEVGFYIQHQFVAICCRVAMLLFIQLFYSVKGNNKRWSDKNEPKQDVRNEGWGLYGRQDCVKLRTTELRSFISCKSVNRYLKV